MICSFSQQFGCLALPLVCGCQISGGSMGTQWGHNGAQWGHNGGTMGLNGGTMGAQWGLNGGTMGPQWGHNGGSMGPVRAGLTWGSGA